MLKPPKERIVWDDDLYDDVFYLEYLESMAEGEDEYWVERLEDFKESGNVDWDILGDIKSEDYDSEISTLKYYFENRENHFGIPPVNPNAGNHLLVGGSVQRWDGTSSGVALYNNLDEALDTSPSRYDRSNVFADCEIFKIWDENGRLHVHGAHHDGAVDVEIRQLTDKGEEIIEQLDYEGDIYDPITIGDVTYHMGDEAKLLHDLWENEELSAVPCYMERQFGCKAMEWDDPVRFNTDPFHVINPDFKTGKWRVHLVMPEGHYGLNNCVTYEKADADKHGMGLPLVEFFDTSQDPSRFPGGQFTGGRYYMSTLLGIDGWNNPISEKSALCLDGGIPAWTVQKNDLQKIANWLEKVHITLNVDMLENVRDWYMQEFPTDELGAAISPDITFEDVWKNLYAGRGVDVYDVLGVGDSIVRERVFNGICERVGCDYGLVYDKWLNSDKQNEFWRVNHPAEKTAPALSEEAPAMKGASEKLSEVQQKFLDAIDWDKVNENIDEIAALLFKDDNR